MWRIVSPCRMANSANFYAGELTRNVKSMTDAIAEVERCRLTPA